MIVNADPLLTILQAVSCSIFRATVPDNSEDAEMLGVQDNILLLLLLMVLPLFAFSHLLNNFMLLEQNFLKKYNLSPLLQIYCQVCIEQLPLNLTI